VTFTPPLIARVLSAVQHSGSADLEVRRITNEVFLSYSTANAQLAGDLARGLEAAGLTVFRAHDNIAISDAWRREINSHLDSSVLLIPLVTQEFNAGPWPNQETGYALGKNKPVVPVIVNHTPLQGLVEDRQGVQFDTADVPGSTSRLIARLREQFPFLFV